ncbi:MAG TPA: trehalose-phosphatase [Solirubrobacterales bacterium]|nr:trehalose-phosphatase [Solirubrobacterales bacterium]
MHSSPTTPELLAPLREAPGRSAVLCDIDGTLAPISPLPGDAVVPGRARDALGELAAAYALVGCVSGRRATEARAMVGLDGLTYVGNHGFEVLGPGEREPRAHPDVEAAVGRAGAFVAGLDHRRLESLGLRVEDKGPIQSLHWRGALDEDAAEREAEELAAAAGDADLEARWGRKVVELRPPAEIDKGSAVARLVEDAGVARALFGGDDVTDLDGFRALRELRASGRLEHAVCVGVASDEGPAEIADLADLVVAGTEGYVDLLEALRP